MSYAGIIIRLLEPGHSGELKRKAQNGASFTYGLSRSDLEPGRNEIAILSFTGQSLDYLSFATETQAAETGRVRMRFSEFFNLDRLPVNELERCPELYAELTGHLARPAARLTAQNWDALLNLIAERRPQAADFIRDLEKLRGMEAPSGSSDAYENIAQEKDATRVALEIFGLDKDEIRSGLRVDEVKVAPFLKNIKQAVLLEDQILSHQSRILPGFERINDYVQGWVEFEKENERVTIFNANRTSVERVLGVDLVYYNHRFDSYVMVQYKRLPKATRGWHFNAAEPQFQKDLTRMKRFASYSGGRQVTRGPLDYRLGGEYFFFKFCKQVLFEPLSTGFVDAFYLPLGFVDCVLQSTKGEERITRLDAENCNRSLSNTEFIYLMRHGWLGTFASPTQTITDIIEASIEGNRSVIAAISRSLG